MGKRWCGKNRQIFELAKEQEQVPVKAGLKDFVDLSSQDFILDLTVSVWKDEQIHNRDR